MSTTVTGGEFDSAGILSSTKAMLGEETLAALSKLQSISNCLQSVGAVNEPKRAFSIAAGNSRRQSTNTNNIKSRSGTPEEENVLSESKFPSADTNNNSDDVANRYQPLKTPVPPATPPSTTEEVGFHEESMTLNIIASGNATTINSVRELGSYLAKTVERLESTLEDHMMQFYTHMKKKADEENAILRSTQSKLPTSFQRSLKKEMELAEQINPDSLNEGKSFSPQRKKELQQCSDTLHSWLYLQLESLMETTKARKGALFLRSSDGYLRQVAEVPSYGTGTGLPTDIGLAAGSTLGTVFQTGVGVNIVRSRYDIAGAAAERENSSSENVLMSSSTVLKIKNGIAMPIFAHGNHAPGSALGVVLVCDKDTGSYFDQQDEHRVWGFTSQARGVLSRYNHTYLLNPPSVDPHALLRAGAKLPPVHHGRGSLDLRMPNPLLLPGINGTTTPTTTTTAGVPVGGPLTPSSTTGAENLSLTEGVHPSPGGGGGAGSHHQEGTLDGAPRLSREPPAKATKQLVVRCASGQNSVLPKDLQSLPSSEITEEAVLDSLAPYMRHIESLWRKALDTITNLREECNKWDDTVNTKNNAIIELEIQQKSLQKQLLRVKTDIAKVKSVVPQHLRDQATITKDVPIPGQQQTGAPLPLSHGSIGAKGRGGGGQHPHLPGSSQSGLPALAAASSINQGSGIFQQQVSPRKDSGRQPGAILAMSTEKLGRGRQPSMPASMAASQSARRTTSGSTSSVAVGPMTARK